MQRVRLFLLAVLLIAGCNMNNEVEPAPEQQEMPEEMPVDFDFLVRYGYGEVTKNEINTYSDTVAKDLIVNGTATANITLTGDEMRSIYDQMREINIMGSLELVPASHNCATTPYQEDSWQVTVDGVTRNLTWSDENCELTDDSRQLLELRTFIEDIVAGKDAYKELPEAEGGYD
ncbi:hypothetical protein MKX70_18740 [Paenibacillus sp. FSL R7-0312]|uniref:hypothetical protein n=1 Tax=unclassified Paenibacillus TaxID=185978 RepID=UPI0004F696E7|nr:hypothetical protein [Paenibacillus sp. FSL R5-0912]AIQ42207.1 hypothetical protein R50912_20775 [Paenibacillus sp. FSL R5-0912]